MKKQLFAGLAVATTLGILTPLTSQAFGLGEINVLSALNEPFKAEIKINALKEEEKDNFDIGIAGSDEFDKAGLDRSFVLTQLKFDVINNTSGAKVLVTSEQVIKEPFLDFLVSASAGSGKLIREYTVLLDPPEFVMNSTKSVMPSRSESSSRKTSVQPNSTTFNASNETVYGPVRKSDTLWNIALKTRPNESVSVQQMMMALLKANPEAFNNNINSLKANYTLTLPSLAEINALSQSQAFQAFKQQNAEWRARQTPPVSAKRTSVESATDKNTGADDTQSTTQMESEQLASADSSSDDEAHLQLVAPDEADNSVDEASPNMDGNPQIDKLTEQLTYAQETIEAQAQENIDFKARMDAMEEQLETMRRLISLKDADLAKLQSLVAEKEKLDPNTPEVEFREDTENTAELSSEEEGQQEPVISDDVGVGELESAVIDESQDIVPTSDTNDVNNSFISELNGFFSRYKYESVGALIILLLLIYLLAKRNRDDDDDNDNDVLITEQDVEPQETDSEDEQFLSNDINEQPSTQAADTNSSTSVEDIPERTVNELIEQAEMFVGYADYIQAKLALEKAVEKEPDNKLISFKLLYILFKQRQADSFISEIDRVHFNSTDSQWPEISAWGQELLPGHPSFSEPSAQFESADEPITDETLQFESVEIQSDEQADISTENDEFLVEETLSSDAGETLDITEDEIAASDSILEFDFQPTEVEKKEFVTSDKNTDENELDDDLLSFETHFSSDITDEEELLMEENHLDDESSLSLDLETDSEPDLEFDIGNLDDIDEAETKLDLASAYVDMEDIDGAKNILNEVLVEGNEEQQSRAQAMLDSLS